VKRDFLLNSEIINILKHSENTCTAWFNIQPVRRMGR